MVTRGSWFYQNGQPFDADMSDVMEQAHLELYAGHKSSEYVIDVKNGGKPPGKLVFIGIMYNNLLKYKGREKRGGRAQKKLSTYVGT